MDIKAVGLSGNILEALMGRTDPELEAINTKVAEATMNKIDALPDVVGNKLAREYAHDMFHKIMAAMRKKEVPFHLPIMAQILRIIADATDERNKLGNELVEKRKNTVKNPSKDVN